jgi:hypothetical protein
MADDIEGVRCSLQAGYQRFVGDARRLRLKCSATDPKSANP